MHNKYNINRSNLCTITEFPYAERRIILLEADVEYCLA